MTMIDYVCKTELSNNQITASEHIDKDSTGRCGLTPVLNNSRGSSHEDLAEAHYRSYEASNSP